VVVLSADKIKQKKTMSEMEDKIEEILHADNNKIKMKTYDYNV
jgi:hypothetical protein